MDNTAVKKSKEKYEALFSTDKIKAAAFDKIAEKYFYANFGTISKADFDTLMFSLYLDQILDFSEEDMSSYSDYKLSKLLGITQAKVSNLKVKKELQYPYDGFLWKKSFGRIMNNYRYEDGKIKLFIPDKNLYYEIKNAIEDAGGYVEVQLNTKLLQITPEYFIDLVLVTREEADRDQIRKEIKKTLDEHRVNTEGFDDRSIGDQLKDNAPGIITDIVAEILETCFPVGGKLFRVTMERIAKEIRNKQ